MHFGILPPYRTGVVADPAWMVAFAQHAEEVGFESLYVVEHAAVGVGYASRYPYASSGRMPLPEDCPIPDPLELLGFLAAHTKRLVLGTGILVLPLHQPVVLAKRLATLDVLSGGRVRLGVGAGWMREELEAVGVEFRTRGRRMDEAIVALRTLWSEGEANHHGEFFSFGPLASYPKPVQPAGIPIHLGGHSSAAARRAGRLGDGFFPLGLDDETLRDRMAQLRTAARAADRDPDVIELTVGGLLEGVNRDAVDHAAEAGAVRMVLSTTTGDLDELRRQMDATARLFGR